MSQKTILSFFKSHEPSNEQTIKLAKSKKNKRADNSLSLEDKKEKSVKRTKRSRQIIESDEEDVVNDENSSLNESTEDKQLDTEKNDEKSNAQDQDNSLEETKKEEHSKEDKQSSQDVIPKRITARKHMKRKQNGEITQTNSVKGKSVKKRKTCISDDEKVENEAMQTDEQSNTKELVSNEIDDEQNGQFHSENSENSSLDESEKSKTSKAKSKKNKTVKRHTKNNPTKRQQKKTPKRNSKDDINETAEKVEKTEDISTDKEKEKHSGKKMKKQKEKDKPSVNEAKNTVKGNKKKSKEIVNNDEEENTEKESFDKIEAKDTKENAEAQSKKPVHSFFDAPRKKQVQKSSNNESIKDDKESPKNFKKINSHSTQNDSSNYNPSKHHYHPIDDATWKRGEKVPYLALARTLEEIENISARLKMIEILANFFRSVIVLTPEDLLCSVYLCLNKVAPEYEGIEMGIGDTVLMKAVAQATGRTVEKIKAEVTVKGDLGLVAESSRGNQRVMFAPPKLTVSGVFSKFKEIAQMAGNAAMSKKIDKIQALFVACHNCEARYIIRSLSGKLRIGLAEQSVLAALAQAAVLTPPNQPYPPQVLNSSSGVPAEAFKKKLEPQMIILKTTYCECPNYDLIIPVLLKEGIEGLPNHCHLTAGIPLKPMLAHPTKGIDEVLRRFDNIEFTCEFKYDGERAQIHALENGDVKIYSRNQENNTSKYPDIISRIPRILKPETKSFIIDSEAVAWDAESKQILPFQVLSTRKRKDAVESEITVQVCIVAFDLLYLNGESLVKYPLKKRRELLHQSFTEIENEFMFVQSTDGKTAETMQEFLEDSIKGNCEGLMIKSLEVDASYEIAKRSHNWLKLKKDYLEGVGDTLDVVVIGAYHGKGKRTGTYGGFLLACYDSENEEFQSICKIGTGFKDEELEAHTTFLKQHVINEPKSYYRFDSSLKPDEWFEPVQVWEIKCADLSKSPVHKAAIGIVDPEKGISLRFPRFIKIREDKKPEDATAASQVAQMYKSQEQVQNQKTKDTKPDDDEEFY